jgi:hypothetical protein
MTAAPSVLPVLRPDVVIVGAGPAGLTAARVLAPRLGGDVLVLDREETAGGIARHSDHLGYGLRDLRMMNLPAYARRLASAAVRTRGRRFAPGPPSPAGRTAAVSRSPPRRGVCGSTPSSWPSEPGSGRARPGSSPVTAPPVCTPPATCRTSSTCTTARSAAEPSSAGTWSAGPPSSPSAGGRRRFGSPSSGPRCAREPRRSGACP